MNDLIIQLERTKADLHKSMQLLRQNGNALAQAEQEYQIAKTQTVLKMKDDGCTITEIQLSIKGRPEVAPKLLERDIAKAMYDANMEHINVAKLELRILENQISREWNNAGQI